MSFEQAATLLNAINQQVTGRASIAPTDTSGFVSMATTTLQAGYDPVIQAISQIVGKTIFSVRPYSRKFAGLQVDNQKFGAITRKLSIADKDFENDRYKDNKGDGRLGPRTIKELLKTEVTPKHKESFS